MDKTRYSAQSNKCHLCGKPLCLIDPIDRKGNQMAGFLTYAVKQLQLRVQSRLITVFPIIPLRGTIVGIAIIKNIGISKGRHLLFFFC